MSEVLDHIELAIAEVTRARTQAAKGTSRQVKNVDELLMLKSTALAWFQTHRRHVQGIDVSSIDAPYQKVLDSTAKFATRTTYLEALKKAKNGLVDARRQIVAVPVSTPSTGADPLPTFSALSSDKTMNSILDRRWKEVQACLASEAFLGATVMMGGLLESLLLARINLEPNKAALYTAKNCPKDKAGKPLPLSEWKLVNMVGVAHDLAWISKSAKDVGNVLRDFRNYIHPHKEHADAIEIRAADARMFWDVCRAVTMQVLASVP